MVVMENDRDWQEEDLTVINAELEEKTPEEIIRWVVENFETKDFALACSFKELAA